MTGYLDVPLAEHFLASLDAWAKLGGKSLVAFHDWEALRDYDPNARLMLTPWSKEHRAQFECVHMLVRSRTVAWGISIVNSLTRDVMIPHHTRASFEEARRAVLT
jgi:hypothetical protein